MFLGRPWKSVGARGSLGPWKSWSLASLCGSPEYTGTMFAARIIAKKTNVFALFAAKVQQKSSEKIWVVFAMLL